MFMGEVTGYIIDRDGSQYEVKRAIVTASAAGNTAVVAAVADRKIRVISYILSAVTANNVKFQRATTDITPLHYMPATSTVVAPQNKHGYAETAVNEALNINLSAATAVGCLVCYIEVP